jgi:hypothetical protein
MLIDAFNRTYRSRRAQLRAWAALGPVWVIVACGGEATKDAAAAAGGSDRFDTPSLGGSATPSGSGADSSPAAGGTPGDPTGGQNGEAPVGGTSGAGAPSGGSSVEDPTPPEKWYCWTLTNGMSGFDRCFCTSEVPPDRADPEERCDSASDNTDFTDCCFRYDDSGVDTCACFTLPGLGGASCEEAMTDLEQTYPGGIRTSVCPATDG